MSAPGLFVSLSLPSGLRCNSSIIPPPSSYVIGCASGLCFPPSLFPVTNVWGCECVSLALSPKYVCSYYLAQFFLLYMCRHLCLTVLVWGPCGEGSAPVFSASLIHRQYLWVCVSVCLRGFPRAALFCAPAPLVSAEFLLAPQSVVPQTGFSHPRGLITL